MSSPSSVRVPVLSKQKVFKAPQRLMLRGLMQKMFWRRSRFCANTIPIVMAAGSAGGTTIVIGPTYDGLSGQGRCPDQPTIQYKHSINNTIITRMVVNFLSDLGRRITQSTDHHRESAFLFQRLSMLIQRCNAVAVLGTFTHTTPEDEM